MARQSTLLVFVPLVISFYKPTHGFLVIPNGHPLHRTKHLKSDRVLYSPLGSIGSSSSPGEYDDSTPSDNKDAKKLLWSIDETAAATEWKRREFLSRTLVASSSSVVGIVTGGPKAAVSASTATEEDLTTRLFNPDGSLRANTSELGVTGDEAKSRTIMSIFPSAPVEGAAGDRALVSRDGGDVSLPEGTTTTTGGKKVRVSYGVPEKWSTDGNYVDKSEGVNAPACDRITVYQAPGLVSSKILDKATTNGVAKTLMIESTGKYNPALPTADLVGGRKSKRDGMEYYEFDLAVAPETCGSSKENLGLGFCPYDSIVLLSATVMDDRMYVMEVECDKDEWRRSNSDLKRVRSSFTVEEMDS